MNYSKQSGLRLLGLTSLLRFPIVGIVSGNINAIIIFGALLSLGFAAVADAQVVTSTLTWTDKSGQDPKINDAEDGFHVYRSINGPPMVKVGDAPANVGTYSDEITQTSVDQVVCYQVTAYNTAGESTPSNQACKKVPPQPWIIPASPTGALVK